MFCDTVRKHMCKTALGDAGRWEFEVGQDTRPINSDTPGIMENSANVKIFVKIYCHLKQLLF